MDVIKLYCFGQNRNTQNNRYSSITQLENSVRALVAELDLMGQCGWDEFSNLDTDDRARVLAWYADNGIDVPSDMADVRDNGDGSAYSSDRMAEAFDEWATNSVLEAYVTGRRSVGETDWTENGLTVVFTVGGPHIEWCDGYVVGYWGSDRVRVATSSDADAMLRGVCGLDA